MTEHLLPEAPEVRVPEADYGQVRFGGNWNDSPNSATTRDLPEFPGGISQGAAGVEVPSLKNRHTPTVTDPTEVHTIRVSVPPPVPGVDIPWNVAVELPGFVPPATRAEVVHDSWLPDDLLHLRDDLQTRFDTYALQAEARQAELSRDRVRIARGLDRISVRIHRLMARVQAHHGLLSVTGDLYALALHGDAEALAVVWGADLDGSLFIDELREILAAIAELMAQAETLNVWESLLTEIPTTERATTPSTEPQPAIPARDFIVSARTVTGPPVTA